MQKLEDNTGASKKNDDAALKYSKNEECASCLSSSLYSSPVSLLFESTSVVSLREGESVSL